MPHPQIKIVGETADGNIRAFSVNPDGSLPISDAPNALYQQVLNASDLLKTIDYLDAGTADERIEAIALSSAALNVEFVDTYTYSGSAGSYRVVAVSRQQGIPG